MVMREVGIDISRSKPKKLTPEMMGKADKVITMGCGAEASAVCPAALVDSEDWKLEDPEGKPLGQIRRIRDETRGRVSRLIESMKEVPLCSK